MSTLTPSGILFPASPDALREPDPMFWKDWQAAEAAGLTWRVFGFDALLSGKVDRAFEFTPGGRGETLLYRGWILKQAEYALLWQELRQRGYALLTGPAEYALANYLPLWYDRVADLTPPAVWTCGVDLDEAWEKAQALGPPPYVVKDHVKSAKERWRQACFVAPGAGREEFQQVCRALVEFRGERFDGGIVVRPYVPLRYLEESPFGGDIFEEYRLYFFRGQLVSASWYDRVGGDEAEFSAFLNLPQRIAAPFFTADVARTERRDLILIEIGDGGVSRLPPKVSAPEFYKCLAEYGTAHC